MERSRWRPTPGTVFGLLALVVAVAGTAIAGPLATKSVLDKKEKKQVKNIAKSQINALASGLAVSNANTAGNAGNADKLDGQDATAFAPAGELHTPARMVLNDPVPGDGSGATATVLNAGVFTISAECRDNTSGSGSDLAILLWNGPSGSSVSGERSDTTLINGTNQSSVDFAFATGSGNAVRSGHLIAVAPNGQVLSMSGSAEVGDPAGDCVFGVTAIGP